jgi:signal transduction histidine kinase
MLALPNWRRLLPYILFAMVMSLYPLTALTIHTAQLHAPMPELYVLANHPSMIYKVYPGSAAETGGVQAGDTILQMNGQPFNPRHLSLQIRRMQVGQLLNLELDRDNQRYIVNIPLVSVRDIVEKRFFLFSTIAFIFWVSSALLVWKRFQRIELRLLFLVCQAISLGLLCPYVDVITWFFTASWAVSLSALGGIFSVLFLFHFNISYPVALGTPRLRRFLIVIVYTLGLLLSALWMIPNYLQIELAGFGGVLTVYVALIVTAAIAAQVFIYLKRASPDERRRLRLIMLGELVAGGPPALLYLGPSAILGHALIPEWLVVLCLSVAPIAYSIATLKHNLFAIDRVLNHSVVTAFFLLAVVVFLLAPISIIYWLMGSWPGSIFLYGGLLLVTSLVIQRVRFTIQHLVDRLFYGGWYDYPRVIERTNDALAGSLEWEQLVDLLAHRVPDLMQLHGGYLQVGEQSTTKLDPSLQPQMQFPLTFDGKRAGLWTVGPRRDGQDFSSDDRRILHTLSHQANIAVNNMLLVKGMRDQLVEIRANREQLAQFDRQLMISREEERASLSRDLHDGPVQSLIALNFQLGMVPSADEASSVHNIREGIKDVIFDLRALCAELRPPMLDTMGLGAALRDLAQEWSAQYGIPVNINQPPDVTLRALPAEIAVNLYRIAQEALSNIARHAEAHHVNIGLDWDGETSLLKMIIEDDGKGFVYDPTGLNTAEGHLGLVNMRERIGLFGGEWELETTPGQGTRISATWPIPHPVQTV